MFNNVAYFGVSSPTYGTFTMGRQSALTSDLVVNYDALSGSNAWSVITFEGATGGGGDTEDRIYDNSYEYRLNVGPVRLAAEAQLGTAATAPPATPSKAISASTIWASRWISSAAKSTDALSVGTTLSRSASRRQCWPPSHSAVPSGV